jgi:chromosome segregation ATPase
MTPPLTPAMSTARNHENLYLKLGEKKAQLGHLLSVIRHCQRQIDSVNLEYTRRWNRYSRAWQDSPEGKEYQQESFGKRSDYERRINEAQAQIERLEKDMNELRRQVRG